MKRHYRKISSPVGDLYLVADASRLHAVIFGVNWSEYSSKHDVEKLDSHLTTLTEKQLGEYFAGERTVFEIPYALPEGTEFQRKVWATLATIPFGKTFTYKQQAEAIGSPNAVRAVGGTNGRNPLSIILPCHRVIASSGRLTGYAGGLDNKEFLLRLEGIRV